MMSLRVAPDWTVEWPRTSATSRAGSVALALPMQLVEHRLIRGLPTRKRALVRAIVLSEPERFFPLTMREVVVDVTRHRDSVGNCFSAYAVSREPLSQLISEGERRGCLVEVVRVADIPGVDLLPADAQMRRRARCVRAVERLTIVTIVGTAVALTFAHVGVTLRVQEARRMIASVPREVSQAVERLPILEATLSHAADDAAESVRNLAALSMLDSLLGDEGYLERVVMRLGKIEEVDVVSYAPERLVSALSARQQNPRLELVQAPEAAGEDGALRRVRLRRGGRL